MAKIAVVFKSKYGSSKQYAQWLRAALDAELIPMPVTAAQLAGFDKVVYVGGMYAGGLSGIAAFKKAWGTGEGKQLILCAVGIAPGNDSQPKQIAERNLPPAMRDKVKVFQLRGTMDYAKMGRIHKIMMGALKTVLKVVKPKGDPSANFIVDTYGKRTDYMDKAAIKPVVAYIRGE